MRYLFVILSFLSLTASAQTGKLYPKYLGHPIDSSQYSILRYSPVLGYGEWSDGSGSDSVTFEGDTVCFIVMGDEICVNLDSIFFTDTSVCYIELPDTTCLDWSSSSGNIYTINGSLPASENRIFEMNSGRLFFQQGGTNRLSLNSLGTLAGGETVEIRNSTILGDFATLELWAGNSSTSSDPFIRFQASGGDGIKYSLGKDRSLNAFVISDTTTLGFDPFFIHYGSMVGNDSLVLNDKVSVYPMLGVNRQPQKALDVIGMMNLKSTTSLQNVFINGGNSSASGGGNVVIGTSLTGDALTSGVSNVIVGVSAASNATTAGSNVAIGNLAGVGLTTGANNILIGTNAGPFLATGSDNIVLGQTAAWTEGSRSVFIGNRTGNGASSQDSCVLIGYRAGIQTVGGARSNSVVIGYKAADGVSSSAGSVILGAHVAEGWGSSPSAGNKLLIDNSATTTPLVDGSFSQDTLHIHGTFRANIDRNTVKVDASSTVYNMTTADYNILTLTATGAKTVSLPNATASTLGYWYKIVNASSSGDIEVGQSFGATDTITGSISGIVTLAPGESAIFRCVLNNYWDQD